METYVRRITYWHDAGGNVVQLAVALLDGATWDALGEATEPLGPFDDVDVALSTAARAARLLVTGEYPGQLPLPIA